jgi:ABC-type Fe3+-siderophore transport system permease subunit
VKGLTNTKKNNNTAPTVKMKKKSCCLFLIKSGKCFVIITFILIYIIARKSQNKIYFILLCLLGTDQAGVCSERVIKVYVFKKSHDFQRKLDDFVYAHEVQYFLLKQYIQ